MNCRPKKLFVLKASIGAVAVFSMISCTQIQKPVAEPFFSATEPPAIQEFRWSNGKLPKSFDPARAGAAPETDIVRAIYEGLTELDPRSLEAVPAAAEKWTASDDNRVWTFNIRATARWSNDKKVTAGDFVAAWKRLSTLGEKTVHRELLKNIVGMGNTSANSAAESEDFQHTGADPSTAPDASAVVDNTATELPPSESGRKPNAESNTGRAKLGVEAIDDNTLKITLETPDKDFPKLVAHQIFRPVYGSGASFEKSPLDKNIVTNGPFVVAESNTSGVVIERSATYWNKDAVKLDRIRFVPKDTAEAALDAYRKGEIDAVTNARFEPLALKLLSPYDDFRRTTHSALNFYEFNAENVPFNDRRVREALAIAIDRERLIETELEGAAQAAADFLPIGERSKSTISFDAKKANDLLDKAGYPRGEGFPPVRLVINRNDTQQRIAAAIARMWKEHLNIDSEIVAVELGDLTRVREAGEFDLIRRGVVLPTTDEAVGLAAIFRSNIKESDSHATVSPISDVTDVAKTEDKTVVNGEDKIQPGNKTDVAKTTDPKLLTRDDALYDLFAIPLYFPQSYSLVKPYVFGFDTNALDAPSIKDVGINASWQPPNTSPQN